MNALNDNIALYERSSSRIYSSSFLLGRDDHIRHRDEVVSDNIHVPKEFMQRLAIQHWRICTCEPILMIRYMQMESSIAKEIEPGCIDSPNSPGSRYVPRMSGSEPGLGA